MTAIALIPSAESHEGRAMIREATHAVAAQGGTFAAGNAFELAQRVAKALAASDMVPAHYRGSVPNCLIAIELAARMKCPVFMVMQNTHIIEGRPTWASSFIIGAVKASGEFSSIRFRFTGTGEPTTYDYETWGGPKGQRTRVAAKLTAPDLTCTAWARELASGDVLDGSPVSVGMAVAEGWYGRPGSKWKTMLHQMMSYRAATFWARLYAPHLISGMGTADESEDAGHAPFHDVPFTDGRGNDGTRQLAPGTGYDSEPVEPTPGREARRVVIDQHVPATRPAALDQPDPYTGDDPTARTMPAAEGEGAA